jgi:amidophosphoribosyltransferase
MGVDMASREELIAANKTVQEIGAYIGADSLQYLSLEGLEEAIGRPMEGHCVACFCGDYPLDLDEDLGKDSLESARS